MCWRIERGTLDDTPSFLQAKVLKPFISEELLISTTPLFYRTKSGKRAAGYDAELLPSVAEVYLQMRDASLAAGKPIPRQYIHIIQACDVIMRGLARVGIVALRAITYDAAGNVVNVQKFGAK